MKCNQCGHNITNEDIKFCPECGAPIKQVIICPKCGQTGIPIVAKYCPTCGESLFLKQVDMVTRFDDKPISECGECTLINGYEAADLGLSVLWATKNIGADSVCSQGLNFVWGDPPRDMITSYLSYWFKNPPKQESICSEPEYDMATSYWRGRWQLPTCEQCVELIERCTWEPICYQGFNFYKVKSLVNGNYILLLPSIKLWVGDRAYRGSVHFLDVSNRIVCSEQYDNAHTYYVRAVAVL